MEADLSAFVSCATTGYKIRHEKIEAIVQKILANLDLGNTSLSLRFVNTAEMIELNSKFRHQPKTTDVLSFPLLQWTSPLVPKVLPSNADQPGRNAKILLGDIAISLPEAKTNAANIGQELDKEVCFLIVHGVLHLCGFDHQTQSDEENMLVRQKSIMKALEETDLPLWEECVVYEESL